MNELLLAITAAFSALFVVGGWKLGKERLYSVMIVFLILVATVGSKLVYFFGHETNTGNVFYASVFLATYFLIERYGRREGLFSIWVGVAAVTFFTLCVQITIALVGSGTTATLNAGLAIALSSTPRIALASLVAYACSQTLNVYVYLFLKERFQSRYLWMRANIANAIAQAVDSLIFFTIAFAGVVTSSSIVGIVLTGFVIKVLYMMAASTLLYLNKIEEEENGSGDVTVTLRMR